MGQEQKIVTRPERQEIIIPANLIQEAKPFVETTMSNATDEFLKTGYGHAAMAMALALLANANNNSSPEAQKVYFKNCALEIIHKQGKGIIPLLPDELRLALTEEDIANLD